MCKDLKTIVTIVALSLLASVATFAGDNTEVRGMIISREGDTLIVVNPNNQQDQTAVRLTANTETKDDTGLFGLGKEQMADTVLIPGLKVRVEGTSEEKGQIIAKTITVDGDDLETSQMIQAGLHPTAQQVEANVQALEALKGRVESQEQSNAAYREAHAKETEANVQKIEQNMNSIEEHTRRFMALSDYDVKDQATVKFAVGSSKLSATSMEQLKQLAATATGLSGYIIEVTGFADATGSAVINDQLSENRAKAVVRYLIQQCSVPVRHIVAPGAMGEYGPAASNETAAGRAENRRVEVKILVNKGIRGQ